MRTRTMIGVMTLGLAVSPALAVDRLVPSKQYPTIQSAVDAAVDGDTIVLAAGTYTQGVQVDNKALAFRGSGVNQTTWRAPVGSRCLWALQTSNKPIAVSDIRFLDFSMPYNAAAVDLEAIAPHTVRRCRFEACSYFALELFGGSLVEDCEFIGTIEGSAVSATQSLTGDPHVFRRCSFRDNTFQNAWFVTAAAMDLYRSNVRLEQCFFRRNNFPVGNGIAIRCVDTSLFVVDTRFCESSTSPISSGFTDGGGNTFTNVSCAPPCPGDIVRDGAVNGADLAIILVAWGTSGSQYPGADIDGNGVVDGSDLGAVLAAWGQCPQ